MARIRDDLDGSVFLHASAGPVVLVAGDEVPEGFVVGAHLLADDEPEEADGKGDQPEPARPKRTRGPRPKRTRGPAKARVADESGDPQPDPAPEATSPTLDAEPAEA